MDASVNMGAMNEHKEPNAQVFCTIGGAASMLRVSRATVRRYITSGVLAAYFPVGGPEEARPTLLDTEEVRRVGAARRALAGRSI